MATPVKWNNLGITINEVQVQVRFFEAQLMQCAASSNSFTVEVDSERLNESIYKPNAIYREFPIDVNSMVANRGAMRVITDFIAARPDVLLARRERYPEYHVIMIEGKAYLKREDVSDPIASHGLGYLHEGAYILLLPLIDMSKAVL